MALSTDWVKYYSSPVGFARLTRWLSSRKILGLINKYINQGTSIQICELGGANSCFMATICNNINISRYHVIDNCEYGLKLLDYRDPINRHVITKQNGDVLGFSDWNPASYDLVFSIGLIEHFNLEDTQKAVAAHFTQVKEGGYVLIAFPTPTLIYCLIRRFLESIGQWNFPDERPLSQNEVRRHCKKYGTVVHETLHYGAVLTQGYILVKAF